MKLKGQSDTSFIMGLVFFLAFAVFVSAMVAEHVPGFTLLTDVDIFYIATEATIIAGACVITTGAACAAALGGFSVVGFFIVSNTLLNTLIIVPCLVVLGFVMARLARGSG